jgi:hypothetical protein
VDSSKWNESKLEYLFEDFGTIENIFMISYSEQTNLSSFVVVFENAQGASNAFEQLEDEMYDFTFEYFEQNHQEECSEEEDLGLSYTMEIGEEDLYEDDSNIFNQSLIDEFNVEIDSVADTIDSYTFDQEEE